jgi:tRNA threonylcarbamoyladenosine biosynthesis protein TsaB
LYPRPDEETMPDFDRVLVLETSGKVGRAALTAEGAVVAEARLGEERRRASDLALVVDRLLRDAGWEPVTLTAVVVGLGPGSYTGLRVGLASAKGLTYAVGCRFFGVETFAAIALRASEGPVSVVADALQGKLFRRDYRRAGNGLEPSGPLEVVTGTDWLAGLRPGMRVTGPAAGAWDGKVPSGVTIAAVADREPRPADLLAVARSYPWAVTMDVWTAEPLYLRGSSADDKAAARS